MTRLEPSEQAVLDAIAALYLEQGRTATAAELAVATKLPPETVRRALGRLVELDYIERGHHVREG